MCAAEQVRERLLGTEHPYTLSTKSKLAMTKRKRGNLKGAEELETEEVLKAREIENSGQREQVVAAMKSKLC